MQYKIPFFLLLVVLIVGGCASSSVEDSTEPAPPPPGAASPMEEPDRTAEQRAARAEELKAAEAVIDRFGHMWEDEDMDTFDEIIAHDPDMIVIGTDTAEYVIGYENFKQIRQEQFDGFENVEFSVNNRDVRLSQNGTVAWFSEVFDLFIMDMQDNPVHLRDLRLTGVLEKRDGDWKIVHLHTSVPIAGQAAAY